MNEEPLEKCCLVRIEKTFNYGLELIEKGDLGIFVDHVKTNIAEGMYEAVIVDFYYIYLPKNGIKITLPRSDFSAIQE